MEKDFDGWNAHKKLIETDTKKILFKEGEIWWCSVGTNVGNESCGKGMLFRRPILILKKLSGENCIGIPLSTKQKSGSWFIEIKVHGEPRWALLYQIRMFSTKRFHRRLAALETDDMKRVKEKLESLLKLSLSSPGPRPRIGGISQKQI